MGRVARYKKIKSFDPCAKRKPGAVDPLYEGRRGKRRKHNAKKIEFDLPPVESEEKKFTKNVNRTEQPANIRSRDLLAKKKLGFVPLDLKEEAKLARLVNDDSRSIKKKKGPAIGEKRIIQGRCEGESMRAFDRRVKHETGQILRNALQIEKTNKKEKRKIFFAKKKMKKKAKRLGLLSQQKFDEDDDNDDAVAENVYSFGEQAERPPEFQQLPRGAVPKSKPKIGTSSLDDEKIAFAQKNMEMLRMKVQAQYARVKLKRKKAGEFHL